MRQPFPCRGLAAAVPALAFCAPHLAAADEAPASTAAPAPTKDGAAPPTGTLPVSGKPIATGLPRRHEGKELAWDPAFNRMDLPEMILTGAAAAVALATNIALRRPHPSQRILVSGGLSPLHRDHDRRGLPLSSAAPDARLRKAVLDLGRPRRQSTRHEQRIRRLRWASHPDSLVRPSRGCPSVPGLRARIPDSRSGLQQRRPAGSLRRHVEVRHPRDRALRRNSRRTGRHLARRDRFRGGGGPQGGVRLRRSASGHHRSAVDLSGTHRLRAAHRCRGGRASVSSAKSSTFRAGTTSCCAPESLPASRSTTTSKPSDSWSSPC